MKKIKKLLLAFAPLTAIAIATPIVLTACSDTTTNNTTPDEDNGGDNSQKPTTPSIQKDNTNSETFALDSQSEAQKILNDYKNAKGKAAADKVLSDALNGFPKKENKTLPSDVLNMWSNNNWFAITKKANDNKVRDTFVSKLTITKAEVIEEAGKTKATFDAKYESGFVDSNGKVYEATQLLKADKVDVDATTKIDINKQLPSDGYKIDGEVQTLPTTSLTAGEGMTPQTNLETFLKQPKVSLDAKAIFDTYITNHSIKHAEEDSKPTVVEGIWTDNIKIIDAEKTKINTEKTQIDVFLTKFADGDDWYGLKKSSTVKNVEDAIYTTTNEKKSLKKEFSDLINNYSSFKEVSVTSTTNAKVVAIIITLKKVSTDANSKTLKLNIATV